MAKYELGERYWQMFYGLTAGPYSDAPVGSKTLANFDAAGQQEAYDAADQLIREILEEGMCEGTPRSLVLWGPLGVGKTHLAAAVWDELQRGPLFITLGACTRFLRDTMRPDYKNPEGFPGPSEIELLRGWCSEGLLILDDVGREPASEFTQRTAYDIIDGRYRNELPILITTNLNPDGLSDYIGAAAVDRLFEMGRFVEMPGTSWRRK